MKAPKFKTEADLCAAFLAWQAKHHPDVRAYAEWAGWDILLVFPEGWQLGIQAKLRLNATVMLQASTDRWDDGSHGPDFRALLVPDTNDYAGVARRLGLVVFSAQVDYFHFRREGCIEFRPELRERWTKTTWPPSEWTDWNPEKRHALPPTQTDAVAGSPCPVSLTPWKLGALAVLAELELAGTITTKRIRDIGIDPRRWTQYRWLQPAAQRGDWIRGEKCPPFDQQHPTAYAAALEKARETLLVCDQERGRG